MKLEELEKRINEEIEKKGLKEEKLSNWELVQSVRDLVSDIIRDTNEVYATDYKSMIIIRKRCSIIHNSIEIKIKKKKAGSEYKYGMYRALYTIDNIVVEKCGDYDSIEGFVEYHKRRIAEKQNYEDKKAEDFEGKLEEVGLEFTQFYDLMEQYKSLNYENKEKLAHKFGGKDYCHYY